MNEQARKIAYLRNPRTIRAHCQQLFALALRDQLAWFRYHPERLQSAADFVLEVIRADYPTLDIPYHSRWRHFDVGGNDRTALLTKRIATQAMVEQARTLFELAIVSVLVDAGAGEAWRYTERSTGMNVGRSEGLAVASWHMFCDGAFGEPYCVNHHGLTQLTETNMAAGFQVTTANPLVGLRERTELLRRLGSVLQYQQWFGSDPNPRLGNLFDTVVRIHVKDNRLDVRDLFAVILETLGPIWPGEHLIGSTNLGDVWTHPRVSGAESTGNLIPFHKLSQWLTYSLVEPFEHAGIHVYGLEHLTGLPEYRNGGLFLDLEVLTPKQPQVLTEIHGLHSEVIVEWRALTVALLDELAEVVRKTLGKSEAELPLCKVLQGGTWTAGRKIAKLKRTQGEPPLRIALGGTFF